jgi:para-nitrobenzyl esterase
MLRRALVACTVIAVACGGSGTPSDPLTVMTADGPVLGKDLGDGVRAFLGVPYASPPVGSNRWRKPQPNVPWTTTRPTVMVGPECPQKLGFSGPGDDEDCLYLNVWTPPNPPAAGAPVFLWIHGGAFVFGAGGDPYYDGEHLALTYGVVVVTMNYRLGALGFFAHTALDHEDPAYPTSGNYGIEDQFAAIQWVHDNIAAFDGDPQRVLLAGESAGGYSTCIHYASPRAKGMFQAVLSESGVCSALSAPHDVATANGALIAQTKLGCTGSDDASVLSCLRGQTTDQLLTAVTVPIMSQSPGGPLFDPTTPLMWPNDDGMAYTGTLASALASPPADIPLLLGTNHDEGALFVSSIFAAPVSNGSDYLNALTVRWGSDTAQTIATQYPIANYASANDALAAVTGDALFVCPARRTARAVAGTGAHVFRYTFQKGLENPLLQGAGVVHSAEIPFVFGNDDYPLGHVGSSGAALSAAMERYWTRFGSAGDPNGSGDPAWPAYDAASDPYVILDAPISAGSGLESTACDFWDTLTLTL